MSSISIQMTGIISTNADCVVNAANSSLLAGGGVCGIIFNAAGARQLQKACNAYGGCPTGSAVITPGFNLKAKYIIHAVGPIWQGGNNREPQHLYGCYRKALELAMQNGCHSICFPLISAGIFGYPKPQAWRKALQSCSDFIKKNPNYNIDIIFAIIDQSTFDLGVATAKSLNIPII